MESGPSVVQASAPSTTWTEARARRRSSMMVAKKETLAEQVEKSWHVLFASLWPYITFPVWKQDVDPSKYSRSALFLMGKKNPFRRFVICLVNWPPFDWLMLLFIVANCITLALYTNDPGFQETKLYTNLVLADFVFVSAFTVEMVIKILALGLLFEGHGTYLLNGWNVFDCAVVIIGWITLLTTLDNYTFLRAFRILRPLRLITIIPALRRIMKATFAAIPMMNNVFILSLFYFSVFGIICLQLFQGKLLYHCGSPDFTYAYSEDINGVSYIRNVSYTFEGRDSINCKGPMASDYQWTNTTGTPFLLADFQPAGGNQWGYVCPFRSSDFSESDLQSYPYGTYCAPYLNPELGYRSFDNILYAWLMVYQHLMVNDWSLPMYSTQQTASWWTWLLDATMIVLGLYLIVKLTVAVLFLGFSRSYGGEETDKNEEVVADGQGQIHTDDGSDPTIAQALDACDRPSFILRKAQLFNEEESWGRGRRVWESFRDVCFVIQGNKWFQNFTVVVIIINAASMAIQWTDMPQLAVLATTYANYAVTMYFALEMAIKLIGLGLTLYLSDKFNIFDGLVTLVGVAEMILSFLPQSFAFAGVNALRGLRLLRVFRLARNWPSLQRIITVLMTSVEAAGWLTLLLGIYLFIIGLIGLTLFGNKLNQCFIDGSIQLCPPGLTWRDCPAHFDCYVPCTASQAYQWFAVPGSPYGGQAYCEVFPRRDPSSISPPPPNPPPLGTNTSDSPPPLPPPSPPSPPFAVTDYTYNLEQALLNSSLQYWAQVGASTPYQPNYDNTYLAMVSAFVLITMDNWDSNAKNLAHITNNNALAFSFTILSQIIGVLIILNLFLAFLLAQLDDFDLSDEEAQAYHPSASLSSQSLNMGPSNNGQNIEASVNIKAIPDLSPFVSEDPFKESSSFAGKDLFSNPNQLEGSIKTKFKSTRLSGSLSGEGALSSRGLLRGKKSLSMFFSDQIRGMQAKINQEREQALSPDSLEGTSLNLFGRKNTMRIFLFKVLNTYLFYNLMLVVVVASCIELCLDNDTVQPGSPLAKAIYVMDIMFVVIFGMEALMKIIVFGLFWNGPKSYLKSGWNIIDFLIVIIGVLILAISAVSQDRGLVWLRVLRSLRVLRVIRLAAEFESIRVVIGAMAKSIPAVGEVLLVALLFYFIFAVLGMNLMADLFFFCADSNSGAIIDSMYVGPSGFLISKDWCDAGSQNITTDVYHQSINVSVPPWQVSTSWGANGVLQRFDNLFQSLWSLFQIATLENWQGIMYQGMNITGPDLQPVYNYSTAMAIYFVVFIIVCSFFVLSLVVGVSIDQFQKLRKITGKSAFLTEKQQEWVLVQKLLASTTPKRRFARPTGYFRNFCFDISMTDPANFLMVGIIILNIITMFLPHYNQGWEWDIALSVCNAVFTGIYVTEVLVKWTALGIPVYFSDPWNIFDFVVALASIAGVFLDFFTPGTTNALPVLRIFRILRIFKLIPRARGLLNIMMTIYFSLPMLANLGTVFLLVIFVFSVMAMNLFGNIKFQSSIYPYSNFNTWPNSMLLLFRMTAMENWTGAMMDCMVLQSCLYVKQTFTYIDTTTGLTKTILQGTYLDSYDNADVLSIIPSSYISNQCSPSPILAAIFFTVYIIIVVLIMVDLITGIIIENLESFVKLEEMKTVTQFHVEDFVDKWEELDPHGTGTIHARHFTALMDGVFPPMGVKGMKQGKDLTVQQITYDTSIPLRDLRFHFLETLHRLCSRVAHVDLPEQEEFAIQGKMIRRLPRDKEEPKYTMGDYYTCAAVTSQIKGFLIRVRLKPFWDAIKAEGSEFVYEDLVEDEDEAIFPMLRGRSAKKSAQSMTNQRQHRLASVTRPGSATSGGSVEGSSTSMTKDERMALLEIASGPSMNRPLTAGHPRSRLGTAGAGLKPPSALNPPSDLNPPAKVASSHSAQDAANPARQSKTKNLGHIKMGSLAAKSANASPTIRGEILLAGPFNPNLSASAVEEDTKPHPFDPQPHDQHHHRGVGIGPGSSHASTRPASESSWKRLGADQPAVVPPLAAHVVYANPLAEDAEVLEAASSSMSQGAPSASDLRQTLPSFTTPKTSRSRKKLPPLRSKE